MSIPDDERNGAIAYAIAVALGVEPPLGRVDVDCRAARLAKLYEEFWQKDLCLTCRNMRLVASGPCPQCRPFTNSGDTTDVR